VDQSNPLSQLTHERRLSALGPGGLNRKRAGFDVRDVHISHYGRICPIETPEGSNIGLIASLALYARLDEYGFLVTPYRKVTHGKVADDVVNLRADEEYDGVLAPADTLVDKNGKIIGDMVLSRVKGEFSTGAGERGAVHRHLAHAAGGRVGRADPVPRARRRQPRAHGQQHAAPGVPLLQTEPPLVATGMERDVASNSGMVVRARKAARSRPWTPSASAVGDGQLRAAQVRGPEREDLPQPEAHREAGPEGGEGPGHRGRRQHQGRRARAGRNILVGFMVWDGYNFEDAIIVSRSSSARTPSPRSTSSTSTSRSARPSWGARSSRATSPTCPRARCRGWTRAASSWSGTKVGPGDILVGKVSPKSKSELTPEEKLLHAIFGRAGEDVKNDSLEVPPGVYGTVIGTRRFTRNVDTSEEQSAKNLRLIRKASASSPTPMRELVTRLIAELKEISPAAIKDDEGKVLGVDEESEPNELRRVFELLRKRCMENYKRGTVREALPRLPRVRGQDRGAGEREEQGRQPPLAR
jgi:DNA-directed RNA polymerase subunit beta